MFKDGQYEFIRPDSSREIEIERKEDIEPQLKLAVEALEKTWDETVTHMEKQIIALMPQVNKEMELQISKKLQQFEKKLSEVEKLVMSKK